MKNTDPFIEGLRRLFATRNDLKPSKVSIDAGLNDSTIRKLLSGANASPKVETAQKIADAMGYPLTTIISLGSHNSSDEILDLLESIGKLPDGDLTELIQFLNYLKSKPRLPKKAASPTIPESSSIHDSDEQPDDGSPALPQRRIAL